MAKKRTLVIGDIHGANLALEQALDRSGFDRAKDHLIILGDIVDGWPETRQCIDTVLGIKNRTFILGNHDKWALDWMKTGIAKKIWTTQGGKATIESYGAKIYDVVPPTKVPESHIELLDTALFYHLDKKDRLFVHGGIEPEGVRPLDLGEHTTYDFLWDRTLIERAMRAWEYDKEGKMPQFTKYKEVYLGHTTTWHLSKVPLNIGEIWAMDQGAGWEGKLSIMDIDSKEFWQSDKVSELYPEAVGRR